VGEGEGVRALEFFLCIRTPSPHPLPCGEREERTRRENDGVHPPSRSKAQPVSINLST